MVYDITLHSLYNEDYIFDKYLDPQPYLGCELTDIFNDDENCSTRRCHQNDAIENDNSIDISLESIDFENLKNDFSCNRLTNIDYTDYEKNHNFKQVKLGKDDILINDDKTGLIDATKGTAANLYLESLSYSYDKFFKSLAQGDLKKQWEVSKSIVDTVMRATENEVRFLQPSGDNKNFSELPKSKFIEITHSILKNHYAPLLSNFDTPMKDKDQKSKSSSSDKNIAFDFSSNRASMIAEITALTEKNKITEKVKSKKKKKRKLKVRATWHKQPIYQVDITDQDVLLGRGGHAIQHPGNKFFRKLASDFREEYNKASKREKTKIAEKIVSLVQSKGRFLKQDETKRRCWYRITGQEIRKKASQALRESK